MSQNDTYDQRQQLLEMRKMMQDHRTVIMPFFGLLFWECVDMPDDVDPDSLAEQGMQLTLAEDHDEILASFLTTFIQLWQSAKDLNAASRFVAEALGMSASELLEARILYCQVRGNDSAPPPSPSPSSR